MKAVLPLALFLAGCVFDVSGVSTDDGPVAPDLAVDGPGAVDFGADGPAVADLQHDLWTDADLGPRPDAPTPLDLAPDQPQLDAPVTDLAGPVCAWSHRRKLRFKNAAQAQNLTAFPVLVVLQQGTSIDYAKTRNVGQDVRFTDADGITPLPYEIERWDKAGKSYLWVKVPQINGASNLDHIWLYHGNAAAKDGQTRAQVWSAGYAGVWHLNNTPSGAKDEIQDSSPKASHGSTKGGMGAGDRVSSPLGWCLDFDGSNDYVDMGDRSQFELKIYSWSIWLNAKGAPTVGSANEQPLWNADTSFNFSWSHWGAAFKQAAAHKDLAGWRTAQIATPLAGGLWYNITATYDGAKLSIYLNGKLEDTVAAGAPVSNTGPLTVGAPISGGVAFPGKVEEVRVSSVARSAEWIKAQYLAQTNSFIVYGAEQKAAPGCPK